jgi:hypothetical protein
VGVGKVEVVGVAGPQRRLPRVSAVVQHLRGSRGRRRRAFSRPRRRGRQAGGATPSATLPLPPPLPLPLLRQPASRACHLPRPGQARPGPQGPGFCRASCAHARACAPSPCRRPGPAPGQTLGSAPRPAWQSGAAGRRESAWAPSPPRLQPGVEQVGGAQREGRPPQPGGAWQRGSGAAGQWGSKAAPLLQPPLASRPAARDVTPRHATPRHATPRHAKPRQPPPHPPSLTSSISILSCSGTCSPSAAAPSS